MNATPRVSLHLIRGFWFAARHLSFTMAAAELFVTQSAISREIKKLEEQLGQPRFRRVNRTLQLTQAGEEMYRTVDEALALIDTATDRLAGAQRYLTVTTTVPLASLWLGPGYRDLRITIPMLTFGLWQATMCLISCRRILTSPFAT